MKKNKIVFEGIPPGTLSLCKKRLLNENIVLKGGIYDRLMKFQKEAVIFGLNRNGRVLLADDMGLGKTIQALAIATYYMVEFPMLIVAPASLLNNWKSSIADFMQTDSTIIGRREDFGNRISIISYNMAVTMIDTIKRCNYGVIIVDECHFLKSNTTKRTRLLLPILQNASRLIMISGTPATSRPVELHPIISALDKKAYPNFNIYGYRYCNGRKIGHFYDFRGSSNAGELAIALEHSFMIRRLKGLVLGQLPKKFRRQIILEGARKKRTGPTADVIGETVPATIMEEYVEAAKIKLEPVTKYLETIVEKDVKSVVFAHHSNMLDGIEVFCREKKVEYIRLDGSTPPSRRQQLVDQYQGDDKIRMAILSITACSTGLTLTAGKAVIFAELYWNPGTMLQAEDRIHRIGQKDSVDIHYLVMSTTVDEYVWPQLLKKLTVLENLGIGKNELKDVRGASSTDQQQCRIDDFISKRM
ncbi:SWI/SNF-related matrix-associated actin-dependent regulator of chromatin subfamily A-like protein 1 [Pancytospora epiphaga]|nr:SWI/SNF-related matrix-associated actin-dependent regulator of chromatin subfamily A-like protein 1 [Pancytospora epiphaga]